MNDVAVSSEELERRNKELESRVAALETEAARLGESEILQAVFDGIDDVIYVADPETYELLHVNAAFTRTWGEGAVGKKCYQVIQGREDPCPFCTNDKIFGKSLGENYVWEFQNKVTGQWFRCSDKAIRWVDGRWVRFELASNITVSKQAEAELRIKNQVFNDSLAAQSVADAEGIINHVNPAFVRLWGYPDKDSAVGNSVGSFFANPEDAVPVLEALDARDAWEGEFLARRINGETFLSRGYATSLRDEQGALVGFQSTSLDVTAEREAVAQLKEAMRALARSNQELEQFAYVASHDLQEPLRMVSSYTQLLARRYKGKLDQDAEDFIGFAVDGANRMQRLIQDLLTYSRVTSRGREMEVVDTHVALGEAVKNLQVLIQETGAMVTNDELPRVQGDSVQIAQLLQNLIGNGIKFRAADQPPRVHISAQRSTEDTKQWIFTVKDNGIGIDPKYFERLFVIFQRLHGKQEYPGTGIGLALCKRIVERHGGSIKLESAPGQGTSLIFTLPAIESTKGALL